MVPRAGSPLGQGVSRIMVPRAGFPLGEGVSRTSLPLSILYTAMPVDTLSDVYDAVHPCSTAPQHSAALTTHRRASATAHARSGVVGRTHLLCDPLQ